jgi:hypothetical protein
LNLKKRRKEVIKMTNPKAKKSLILSKIRKEVTLERKKRKAKKTFSCGDQGCSESNCGNYCSES